MYIKKIIFGVAFTLFVALPAFGLSWGEMEGRIKDTLESLNLGKHSIESEYHSGTLTVTGYVSSSDEKREVVDALGKLNGVSKVEDHLEVKAGPSMTTAVDDSARKAAQEAVKNLTGLGSYEVNVESENGRLVMTGSAASERDRKRIDQAVKMAVGNKTVEDDLKLTAPTPDPIVEKNVWDALHRENDLDTAGVTLTVDDGVVTVSGVKSSHRVIDRILSIVNMADGVREVKSTMRLGK